MGKARLDIILEGTTLALLYPSMEKAFAEQERLMGLMNATPPPMQAMTEINNPVMSAQVAIWRIQGVCVIDINAARREQLEEASHNAAHQIALSRRANDAVLK